MIRPGLILFALLTIAPQAFSQATVPTTDRPPTGGQVPPTGGQFVPVTPPAAGGQVTPPTGSGVPVTPPPAPQPDKIDPAIKDQLEKWEKVMRESKNFYSKGTMKSTNLIAKKSVERSFDMMCMKPNFARMRLEAKPTQGIKPDPNDYTAYICDGKSIFEYDGVSKTRTEYKLRGNGHLLLDFMSGAVTAEAALTRFTIKLIQNDENYFYYELRPKNPQDKMEFDAMILVLFKPHVEKVAWLPRTVLLRKNNNQEEEEWNFPQPMVNAQGITEDVFKAVPAPKDWKSVVKDPLAPPTKPNDQPRVIRPGTP